MEQKLRSPLRLARRHLAIRRPARGRQENLSRFHPTVEKLPARRRVFHRADLLLIGPAAVPWGGFSARRRELLDQLVVEFDAVVKILHPHAFVLAMGTAVISLEKHAGDSVGGDAGDARVLPVSGP